MIQSVWFSLSSPECPHKHIVVASVVLWCWWQLQIFIFFSSHLLHQSKPLIRSCTLVVSFLLCSIPSNLACLYFPSPFSCLLSVWIAAGCVRGCVYVCCLEPDADDFVLSMMFSVPEWKSRLRVRSIYTHEQEILWVWWWWKCCWFCEALFKLLTELF